MTDLELYNISLTIFDTEITQSDLDSETPSKEVRLCNAYHDIAILRVMREFDWSFLIVKLTIGEDDGAGMGFLHSYELPENVLKVVHKFTEYAYEIIGGKIYTDVEDPDVYGIMTTIPISNVPYDFYELVAYALAFQIAPLLVPQSKMDQVVLQKYTWALGGLISAECHNNSREVTDGRYSSQ